MKKFRKWLAEFLLGYELVEYGRIMREWVDTLRLAEEVNENSMEVNKLSKKMIDYSHEVIERYEAILGKSDEVNANETLD